MVALRQGYADLVIAGAAEEYTGPNAWAHFLAIDEAAREHSPLTEGCAMFALELATTAEQKERKGLAEILGAVLATYDSNASQAEKVQALTACIGNVLQQSSIIPQQIALVCKSALEPELSEIEDMAIRHALAGNPEVLCIHTNEFLGNAVSAMAAFQLAVLLTRIAEDPRSGAPCGLLIAIDGSGSLGAMLIRREQ
jgi:3-oxoacyl-(acyl-carrier-protein) synthase